MFAIPEEIPLDVSKLWEKSSLCAAGIEGAWYFLFDNLKFSERKSKKLKETIRESIDNCYTTLVTESKVSISLALFGPPGTGKSFFLNSILNLGLRDEFKVERGPLPSKGGYSVTRVPICVKYGKYVNVLLRNKDGSCEEWLSNRKMEIGTLAEVKTLLIEMFERKQSLKNARCIELQGPFPVFLDLKKTRAITSPGLHPELEVDVEFVDLPGVGDSIGDDARSEEVRKADVVLFFSSSQRGRQVSPKDIGAIFDSYVELGFTSRPKMVHVVNDDSPSAPSLDTFDDLYRQKRKDVENAWHDFCSGNDYQPQRETLPQLNKANFLQKLTEESDVIYFHKDIGNLLSSLQRVISEHVHCVKIKQTLHPFLQNVFFVAKKLKQKIGKDIASEKKRNLETVEANVVTINAGEADFEMYIDRDEASEHLKSFIDRDDLPLTESDLERVHTFLYERFLYSKTMMSFLQYMLEQSLDLFFDSLIGQQESDLVELVEVLIKSRIHHFCTESATAYISHILEKLKKKNPFGQKERKRWVNANVQERKEQCRKTLHGYLKRITSELEKRPSRPDKKSHFYLIESLIRDANGLFALGTLRGPNVLNVLEWLYTRLKSMISFCNKAIREINPHPRLDVTKLTSLPEEMRDAHEDNSKCFQCSHDDIIERAMKDLSNDECDAGAVISSLEKKLKLGNQVPPTEDLVLWANALVSVLSDEDHFDVKLKSPLGLDHDSEDVKKLLKQARERLFVYQKSHATCKIVTDESLANKDEIHLKKSGGENCLEVCMSESMAKNVFDIPGNFENPMCQVAPIFIPTIHPGPADNVRGNYFLEENPWEDGEIEGSPKEDDSLHLNIFLVVEKRQLQQFKTTIEKCRSPNNVKLRYVVLPQNGRGIGVTRAIIKLVAECFKFTLYWTIDDDIQYMYQFDDNDLRWHKCPIERGLLFGQRVFQTCVAKTAKKISDEERNELCEEVEVHRPTFAKKTWRSARQLLLDRTEFGKVQKNPALLRSPFKFFSDDCQGDPEKEQSLESYLQYFVDKCVEVLFEDTVYHIAGVSLGHRSTQRSDYTSRYSKAHYMCSEQRYQVVLNNSLALKGRNFVSDEVVFHDDEFQINNSRKRNNPFWGIRGEDKLFCQSLAVSGVTGYKVITVNHDHKKLINVFNKIRPSYLHSEDDSEQEI